VLSGDSRHVLVIAGTGLGDHGPALLSLALMTLSSVTSAQIWVRISGIRRNAIYDLSHKPDPPYENIYLARTVPYLDEAVLGPPL